MSDAGLRSQLTQLGYRPMPWANGGGTTWEIARAPQHGPEFTYRVSIAEIDGDGPFSQLPGVDRIFTLASPGAITLTIDGADHRARFAEPLAFSGDGRAACTVPQPVCALNVMTRRGVAAATVEILQPGARGARGTAATPPPGATVPVPARTILSADSTETCLAVPLTAGATLVTGDETRPLSPYEAVTIGQVAIDLDGECDIAVIRISACDST